ncbi:precorrin-4 C(11)-methyltransferase [Corynebacterium diphtheriae]|uniref:precorrin-4 C(11)-methyltransferase n=1 Tax=Corynebacterium diphtheriae TaxID=1717 RepID=UPI0008FAFD65|nr:precorrin-4 C(11)-methyltransferase [Corynebacterium diphtheriae]OIS01483.1 precorrin-4 C(11)-methyltransferase [Corynebacterium diphtheriae]CAB0696530.1 precorrin-4 C(11)-methyltransferase [Corynebacterium diphtheriae]CAB0799050.1 precorrin-4 C(11)-methyltransferase [Corynebacterium diphtheriae]CAB0866063.1 precorrin-4 C(11)-methyltransferase [Corynebacterium diphtheriae]CAB0881788.1 precorrin-4 C(11)-methyltransferase [Corynebacterium diphtheriae]
MTVYFIGAGPGAADLLTLRAHSIIKSAQVCMYAGSIVPPEVLESVPQNAEVINTARMPLDQIMEKIVAAHKNGHDVARLQSGDPSIYSAVAEQARRLTALGIDYQIVPGVPAFAAVAAALGHELTVPTVGQTVILTRVSGRASAMPQGEDLPTLGKSGATLCIHLAAHDIDRVVSELLPQYGEYCPAAVVAYASRPEEAIVRGTLADIAEKTRSAEITRTAIIVVGKVLGAEGFPDSFLYSDDRPRDEHGRTIPCAH